MQISPLSGQTLHPKSMGKEQIIATLNTAYFSGDPDEAKILRHFPKLLGDAPSFVDLRASLGQFNRLASELMRDADILAVEAVSGNRIRALHVAVSNQRGKVAFQVTN